MDVIDIPAEQRWNTWKAEGARLDSLRVSRMRYVFMIAALAPVLWLFWRL